MEHFHIRFGQVGSIRPREGQMNRFQVRYTCDPSFQDAFGLCRERMRDLTPEVRLSNKTITNAGVMSLRNMAIDELLKLDAEVRQFDGETKKGALVSAAHISRSFEDVGRYVQASAAFNHGLRRTLFYFFHYGVLNLSRVPDQTFKDLVMTSLAYQDEAPTIID